MPKLPIVRARALIRVLKKLGFSISHQVGSHAQLKNANGLRVTVPVHGSKDLDKKTLKGILDDLELSVEEFIVLLRK